MCVCVCSGLLWWFCGGRYSHNEKSLVLLLDFLTADSRYRCASRWQSRRSMTLFLRIHFEESAWENSLANRCGEKPFPLFLRCCVDVSGSALADLVAPDSVSATRITLGDGKHTFYPLR